MTTLRKPTPPTTTAVDQFCGQFDHLCNRRAARAAFRHYLIELLLPREHHKALVVLAARVPGTTRQRLRTKPELAGELIEEARAAGIPFRSVVTDGSSGENPTLEARPWEAKIP